MITVIQSDNITKAQLTFYEGKTKIFETQAFIGRNGMTKHKIEGDGKTPEGKYKLGIAFGMHDRSCLKLKTDIKYIQINENLYWVDDIKSKYYNQMVDITKVKKDWNSAEHLIEYKNQYEYAIEIKTNSKNIPGKRKCDIFAL